MSRKNEKEKHSLTVSSPSSPPTAPLHLGGKGVGETAADPACPLAVLLLGRRNLRSACLHCTMHNTHRNVTRTPPRDDRSGRHTASGAKNTREQGSSRHRAPPRKTCWNDAQFRSAPRPSARPTTAAQPCAQALTQPKKRKTEELILRPTQTNVPGTWNLGGLYLPCQRAAAVDSLHRRWSYRHRHQPPILRPVPPSVYCAPPAAPAIGGRVQRRGHIAVRGAVRVNVPLGSRSNVEPRTEAHIARENRNTKRKIRGKHGCNWGVAS